MHITHSGYSELNLWLSIILWQQIGRCSPGKPEDSLVIHRNRRRRDSQVGSTFTGGVVSGFRASEEMGCSEEGPTLEDWILRKVKNGKDIIKY